MHPLCAWICKTPPAVQAASVQKGDIQERSELHGQDSLLAASVVDAEDLVEIFLVPCHIDAHGPALPVDGQGVVFLAGVPFLLRLADFCGGRRSSLAKIGARLRVAVPCFCCRRRRAFAKDRPLPLLRFGCFCRRQRLSCAASFASLFHPLDAVGSAARRPRSGTGLPCKGRLPPA